MNDSSAYKELVETVERIAHNPPLPGARKAICRCLDCLGTFHHQARISTEQWVTLKSILLEDRP
jgi:hypothetical protein